MLRFTQLQNLGLQKGRITFKTETDTSSFMKSLKTYLFLM